MCASARNMMLRSTDYVCKCKEGDHPHPTPPPTSCVASTMSASSRNAIIPPPHPCRPPGNPPSLGSFDTPFATLKNLKAIRIIAELMKNLTRKNHMARQIINWGPPQQPSPSQSDRTFCDCFCWQQPTTCRHLTVFRNWNRGICWNVLRGPFSRTTNWATKKKPN